MRRPKNCICSFSKASMQFSSHHFAYIQIPMFTGPIASHPFLGIASHNFQVQSSSRLHGFTFLRSLRFTLFPGCFFFFQIASHPFLAIPSHHFTVSKDSFAGSKGSHHLRVSTASFIFSHCFTSFYRVRFMSSAMLNFLQKIADWSVVEFDWIGDVDGSDIERNDLHCQRNQIRHCLHRELRSHRTTTHLSF